jgi:acetyl esterase/lipase
MKVKTLFLIITSVTLFTACSKKLTHIQGKTVEEVATIYSVMKDVLYGSDAEQKMDIYLAKDAKSLGKRNYTVVFLHGGGYYFSDKSQEERYIEPYLQKGMNVVNLNYRLKRGISMASSDLTNASNFLKTNNGSYNLNLENIIVTGFSAGAHIAINVGVSVNNPEYAHKLDNGIKISGVINFSGSVARLDIVEKTFLDSEIEAYQMVGKALFSSEGYESKDVIAVYEPITYFDKADPPVFLWQGGEDDQIIPETYKPFIPLLRKNKDVHVFVPNGKHSPTEEEFRKAYVEIFTFLDEL